MRSVKDPINTHVFEMALYSSRNVGSYLDVRQSLLLEEGALVQIERGTQTGTAARFDDLRGLTYYDGLVYFLDSVAGVLGSFDPVTGDVVTLAGTPYATDCPPGEKLGFFSVELLVVSRTGSSPPVPTMNISGTPSPSRSETNTSLLLSGDQSKSKSAPDLRVRFRSSSPSSVMT